MHAMLLVDRAACWHALNLPCMCMYEYMTCIASLPVSDCLIGLMASSVGGCMPIDHQQAHAGKGARGEGGWTVCKIIIIMRGIS